MAITQKQLGNVIRVLDIPANGQVGTPEELSTVRAFIFNQTTENVIVSLPDPDVIDSERTIVIVNNGEVPLVVQGMNVKPGPSYGLFWNGFTYSPASTEGIGTVSFTESTDGVEIEGNGEENDPLTINVKLSAQANNSLQLLADGLFSSAAAVAVGSGRLLWVDNVAGNDTTGVGDFSRPFASVSAAMLVANAGDSIAIIPGSYNENITFKDGVYVFAFGGRVENSINRVRLSGDHVFASALYENIEFHYATQATIRLLNVAGASFLSCSINRSDVGSSPNVIELISGNSGTINFVDCFINGDLAVTSGQTTAVTVNVIRPRSLGSVKGNGALASIGVYDAIEAGAISHTAGKIEYNRVARIRKNSGGISVLSTAVIDGNNQLVISNSSLRQSDGTYGTFVKSGDCAYALSQVDRNVAGDIETGEIIRPFPANDIRITFTPVSYSPENNSVNAHIKALDQALANLSVSINISDTNTVALSGEGTTNSPLTAEVIIDPDPSNLLTSSPDGLNVRGTATSTGRTWWVDYVNGNDTENTGQFGSPFATISKAVTEASSVDLIKIFPGAYAEDIVLSDVSKQNLLFEGYGLPDAAIVEIHGHILISGAYVRPKMKNIHLIGQTAGVAALTLDGCEGQLKWEQVTISHALGATEKAIEFLGDNKTWFEFDSCGIIARVVIEDAAQVSNLEINFLNLFDVIPEIVLNVPTATVRIDAKKLGNVIHHSGSLTIENIKHFQALNTPAILSDADVGFLRLNNMAMIDSSLNYVDLQKTGTCPYSFTNVVREYDVNEVIGGTPILASLARDIHAAYDPNIYEPSSTAVSDHLNAIDVLLSKDVEVVVNFTGGWIEDELLLVYPVHQSFTIPENMVDSLFHVEAAGSLATSMEVYKGATLIGEVDFTGTVATAVVTETAFANGDILTLRATSNASFTVIAMTVAASKV